MNSFQQFKLLPFMIDALTEKRITKPTDIQARIIPAALNGRDIIGKSQTGTGKTLAFLLPIVEAINPEEASVQAIVVAPTRELAWQIHEELKSILIKNPDYIKSSLIVGGTDRERQIDKMKNPPQLIVGTPGRILDLMKVQALFSHKVTHFVVDEADQMLDMGFLPEVDRIAQSLPEKLQTMVFSATIPEKLEPFLKKYLHDPRFAEASPEDRVAPKIKHHVIPVRHRDRKDLTVEIAKAINPFVCLVFTNTKQEADELETSFREAGLNVGTLHGDMQARRRKQAIKDINDAKYQYVIATDLAARGIDISGVSHVINHGIPKDLDFYTHRVGRTGRAGASGEAYTLYEDHENGPINRLEERGFEFTHVDLRNGSIQPIKTRRRRQTDRKMKVSHTAHSRMAGEIKKAKKKVKPGYKKKFKYKLKETASREHMQQQRTDRRAARKKNKR
ncbi:MAG: DEAD/DEAH box helicase [Exiguobacterium marinum]|uniref:DEAD/DEAH box helicase n=1 Tax=Exiguobacterium marinum TaxID=273528 RepID=A0ABY7WVI9_9BACL|nr:MULTISPECIES: DEAD/DEAH box helicase [Exiguobacterium]WDH74890.1 DEAD/DEAH box helicase [Exiguobacterium marinum]